MHAVTDQQRCLARVPLPGSNPCGFACLFVSNSALEPLAIKQSYYSFIFWFSDRQYGSGVDLLINKPRLLVCLLIYFVIKQLIKPRGLILVVN